ncbi:tRNA (adenosine(37)-N6)-threonylcarbamoyltransferase complex dimerization subunit type 1 TsaB [Halalkalibacillus sediminis]|uniref:tRNA (Adenosine(37)-N6)-threonylcarbamoyltransferase complex dimerization subunit type 1 TsaB n=1 Tax=Halalkalibacillus sediminis TaxID=2018042 RepID=A0A2I0QQD3_9BACI|nr:tRNA (adenosine(37)-N6)-threonylcarbamoyltransferase complex dimerization subunit type 1 TsaB [Halalkalibacillus sediminis]PKR76531.1 tRNA (adenosine(37)-N6)-threonylcarbamoyltransferase complex dimerization subunit type 1 TsaB [Halalkalibacillus sediminis]
MNILAIDTSNQPMSVAITSDNTLLAEWTVNVKRNHSIQLMPAIEMVMKDVNLKPADIDKIVVADGPGSYTALRIAMTTAKTLAWTLQIPIVGISSLRTLASNFMHSQELICPFFDARRGNVFTGLYQSEGDDMKAVIEDQNIAMEDWLGQLKEYNQPIRFVTPQGENFDELINEHFGEHAVIVKDYSRVPRASQLAWLGKDEQEAPVHLIQPEYHRVTEAEANWIKKNQEHGSNG